MYKIPSLFIKGILIGIGKIIPGVSGSMIALNLGLYEKAIDSISNFFKDKKNNFVFLSIVGSGILFSIIVGSRLISYFLNNFYFITMLFFIGLLFGTIPSLLFKLELNNKKQLVFFIIIFVIMVIICFKKNDNMYVYSDDFYNNLFVFIIGIIDAITMIIPGISGTAIFMIMGCYQFFLEIFIKLNSFTQIYSNIKIIFLFTLGLFLGIILISKFINYLLNYKKNIIYPLIIAFSLSSILILFINTFCVKFNLIDLFLGIFLLFLGMNLSINLE